MSKPSNRPEIWQAFRQHCCRTACQISGQLEISRFISHGFEATRDLVARRPYVWWVGSLHCRQRSVVTVRNGGQDVGRTPYIQHTRARSQLKTDFWHDFLNNLQREYWCMTTPSESHSAAPRKRQEYKQCNKQCRALQQQIFTQGPVMRKMCSCNFTMAWMLHKHCREDWFTLAYIQCAPISRGHFFHITHERHPKLAR